MILRGATSLWGALEGVGPENRDFFGPWNGTGQGTKESRKCLFTPSQSPEFHDCFRDREKMSRRELLDIAIKYINFLNTLIKMQQNEEI